MKKYLLSWTKGRSTHAEGGYTKNFVWSDILDKLNDINSDAGTVGLEIIEPQDVGPQSLQVQTDNKKSVISLGEDDGENYTVRSFVNPTPEKEKINILGNNWPDSVVCSDFNSVIKIFKDFYNFGNVSEDFLSE
jgi:hypothetical protein